jgi:prolyl-tRNA synthetase
VPIYVDRSLEGAYNLTCGANKEGYHHFGFKPDRDLKQFKGFHDLRMAQRRGCLRPLRQGHVRGVPRHRSGPGLQARDEILHVDEVRVSRRGGRRAADGDGCYGIGITRDDRAP